MKKILLTLFVAASLISCSKGDDGGSAVPVNQVSFGDSIINFNNTNVIAYSYDTIHYNMEFSIEGTANDGNEAELSIITPGVDGNPNTTKYFYPTSGTTTVTKIEENVMDMVVASEGSQTGAVTFTRTIEIASTVEMVG